MMTARKMEQVKTSSILSVRANTPQLSKYVVFDIESTGIDIKLDDPIEIYCTKIQNNVLVSGYHTYIHTTQKLPERVVAMTQINQEQIENAPSLHSVLTKVYEDY